MLEPGDLYFTSDERTEDILRYAPGGYHPVIMGDILRDPRATKGPGYRIMHKLGYGAFATVWLAQRSDTNAFVSVKVTTANSTASQEVEMMRAAAAPMREHSQDNILPLLDSWTFDGPNGRHTVIVTTVVAPLSSLRHSSHPPEWRKAVAQGLARAVEQLHVRNIVHGDLHIGNAGVSVPQLAQQDPWDVMQDLSYPEVTIVLPTTAEKQTSSLPAYLLTPCDIADYYSRIKTDEPPHTRVFDFGAAHAVGDKPSEFQCVASICAPEVAFAFCVEKNENPPVDRAADIWALGTSIFEIVAGWSLFSVGLPSIPSCAAQSAGYVPTAWQTWWSTMPKAPDVSPDAAQRFWKEKREMLRRHCADDADVDHLIVLLKKLLTLDPAARPSAAEVVNDPWFAGSATVSSDRDADSPIIHKSG